MNIFQKLKLLFLYSEEIGLLARDIQIKKENQERDATKYNLNLCLKHKQESKHSYYSENNCDYCNALNGIIREIDKEN